MENYKEIMIPILTWVLGILGAFLKFKFSSKYEKDERRKIYEVIKEIDELNIDNQLKKLLVEDYKRAAIYDIKGLNVNLKEYLIIHKSRIFEIFSNSQIKSASKYFKYQDKKLKIKIPWYEIVKSNIILIIACIYLIIAIGILIKFSNDPDLIKVLLIIGVSGFTMFFGFMMIADLVSPVKVAKMIKKELIKNPEMIADMKNNINPVGYTERYF